MRAPYCTSAIKGQKLNSWEQSHLGPKIIKPRPCRILNSTATSPRGTTVCVALSNQAQITDKYSRTISFIMSRKSCIKDPNIFLTLPQVRDQVKWNSVTRFWKECNESTIFQQERFKLDFANWKVPRIERLINVQVDCTDHDQVMDALIKTLFFKNFV